MAPTAETVKLLRWSQDEIDILVQMTNDQLELEAQDASMMISWNQHWKKVSSRLAANGFNRSSTACRGIWKRGVEASRANREAAGPDWDDSEHEILVHMTKKQLDLEKSNSSAIIPWAKHWKKVSLQLEQSGYDRTPDNCAAYWLLVESGEEMISEMEEDEDDQPLEDDRPPEDNQSPGAAENILPSDLAVTSPQTSKASLWSLEEYENLLRLLKARRELEETKELEQLEGKKFWTEIAQSHKNSGYDRSFEACKTFWNKQGRERSGYDERVKPSTSLNTTQSSTTKSIDESKPSSVSLWSSVNAAEFEEPILRNPAIEALRFQEEHSAENIPSTEPISAVPTSMQPIVTNTGSESDHEQIESSPGHSEKKRRRKGVTKFRLTPEQRAVLEAEVAKSGIITSERKQELALELDLEYKTVRNWFTNYNVKARRSQGTIPIIPTEKSANSDFDDSFHDSERRSTSHQTNPAAATPSPYEGFASASVPIKGPPKRPHSSDHDASPPTKSRLGPYDRHLQRESSPDQERPKPSSGFNPVNGVSSRAPVTQSHASPATQLPRPLGVVEERSAIPMKSAEIKTSPSIIKPALPDNVRTVLPQTALYPTRMIYSDQNSPNVNTEAPGQPRENVSARERIMESGTPTPTQYEFRSEVHNSIMGVHAMPASMKEHQRDSLFLAQAEAEVVNGRKKLPGLERRYPTEPTRPDPAIVHRTTLPSSKIYSSVSPNPEAAQSTLRKSGMNDQPISKPGPAGTPVYHTGRRSTERQDAMVAPKPARTFTPINDMSSMSPAPANEDLKATAYRTVQTFSSEIESLKQANAIRTTRIENLEQQLSNFADKRAEVDRIKQAEITRALQEIEKRFEDQHTALRQQEDWLQTSRDAEVEGLKRSTLELSKKEKGLVRWQGIVEYYDNDGEDS